MGEACLRPGIVEVADDGTVISVQPFSTEIPATVYVPTPLTVRSSRLYGLK